MKSGARHRRPIEPALLTMLIDVPTQVIADSLFKDVAHMSANHAHMVLKAVLTHIFHQVLQVGDLTNGDTPVHSIGIVGDDALSQVGFNDSFGIICRDAEVGHVTRGHFPFHSSEGIFLSENGTQDVKASDFNLVLEE